MVGYVEIHEVRNSFKDVPVINYDVPHAQLNFRDGERNHNEDLVKFDHNHFGLLQNLVAHVQLHLYVLEFIGPQLLLLGP